MYLTTSDRLRIFFIPIKYITYLPKKKLYRHIFFIQKYTTVSYKNMHIIGIIKTYFTKCYRYIIFSKTITYFFFQQFYGITI